MTLPPFGLHCGVVLANSAEVDGPCENFACSGRTWPKHEVKKPERGERGGSRRGVPSEVS